MCKPSMTAPHLKQAFGLQSRVQEAAGFDSVLAGKSALDRGKETTSWNNVESLP